MAKPSTLPLWATTGTIAEPSSGKKATGWELNERPPYEYFNWWQNNVYSWVSYLNDRFEAGGALFSLTGISATAGDDDIWLSDSTPGVRLIDSTSSSNDFRIGVNGGELVVSVDTDNDGQVDSNGHFDDMPAFLVLTSTSSRRRVGINTSPTYLLEMLGSSATVAADDIVLNDGSPGIRLNDTAGGLNATDFRIGLLDGIFKITHDTAGNGVDGSGDHTIQPFTIDAPNSRVGFFTSSPSTRVQFGSQSATAGEDDVSVSDTTPGFRLIDSTSSSNDFRIGANAGLMKISVDTDSDGVLDSDGHFDDKPNMFVIDGTNSRVGIGLVPAEEALEILGSIRGQSATANATLKETNYVCAHQLNAEEPAFIIGANSDPTGLGSNSVYIGGGHASYNAASVIYFYAAGDDTTVTGTMMMIINSDGLATGVSPTPSANAYVSCESNGGTKSPLRIKPLSGAPSLFDEGCIYYDSSDHKLKVRTNAGWADLH